MLLNLYSFFLERFVFDNYAEESMRWATEWFREITDALSAVQLGTAETGLPKGE